MKASHALSIVLAMAEHLYKQYGVACKPATCPHDVEEAFKDVKALTKDIEGLEQDMIEVKFGKDGPSTECAHPQDKQDSHVPQDKQVTKSIGGAFRLRSMYTAGTMTVYRRYMRKGYSQNDKPFVIGTECNGRLILLEEFSFLKDAQDWAEMNRKG